MAGAGVAERTCSDNYSREKAKGDSNDQVKQPARVGCNRQVGQLVAKDLKKRKANFSVGSRRKENLKELADQFGASRFIDLDDPRTFDEALKNITGIFLITGYTVDMRIPEHRD